MKRSRTKFLVGVILCVLTLVVWGGSALAAVAAIPVAERQALIDFYNSTNGDNWKNNSGWKTPPLDTDGFSMPGTESDWYGVIVTDGLVTHLSLDFNGLSGRIPDSIGNLTYLRFLDLGSNQLTGSIPHSIRNLINLTCLDINWNKLTGAIPDWIGSNLTNLESLYLLGNQLSGDIPDSIGNLTNLEVLWLGDNQLEGGDIPDWIGSLTNLESINLSDCHLTGNIPDSMGNLKNLTYLDLESNNLTGTLPDWICNLTNLQYLRLGRNQLTGTIPSDIGNLTQLDNLHLHENHLTGEVPASIKNLKGIYNGTYFSYMNLCGNRLFTNDLSVRAFLDSKHQNGNFQVCQWSSRILTGEEHTFEVKGNEFVQLYGASSGSNEIHVARWGRLKFMHALGNNTIVLEEDSTGFRVWRSGSTVYFKCCTGTKISIPATTEEQTIRFADKFFILRIQNGKVMLNSEVVSLQEKEL